MRDFDNFGGVATQIPHLSTVLNLSVAASVGIALDYHRIESTQLITGGNLGIDQLRRRDLLFS